MKVLMKKTISIFLSLVMMLSVFSGLNFSVYADDTSSQGQSILLKEDAEGKAVPSDWSTESSKSGLQWVVGNGDRGTGSAAHSGNYNFLCYSEYRGDYAYLITPTIDLSSVESSTLELWYINRAFGGEYDYFDVCYRVSGGDWNTIFSTQENHESLTELVLSLPTGALADNLQIGFKMTSNYGYGLALDDIILYGKASSEVIAKVVDDETTKFFEDITKAVSAENWVEGSTLTLLNDVNTNATITVPEGVHTLDLNGFGLKATGSSSYSVITVPSNAELTLNDSGNTEHKYTVDENGLATVNDNAEGTEGEDYFTFTGGYITGASGSSINGGGVSNGGMFTMNGGTIIGNSTDSRGGGISNFGTANINGGLITYNRAIGWGGGIYLSDKVANTVNLSGGTITHNAAGNGGGIHISANDRVNISGSPIVEDNLSINSNPEPELNNVNLAQDGIISVTGQLENGASIGVRSSDGASIITNSSNTEYNDVSKFTSDNGDYVIGKDASSSQLKIHTPYTVQWLNENNDILETDNDVAEGEIPTYDGEAPTKPNDTQAMYVFDEWSPEVVAATGNVSYTATYKETTPVAKVDDTLFGSITNAVKAENWVEGSTLTLLANIDTTATVTVPDGVHTLNLNGYGLRATGDSSYSVITVPSNAELTLTDSDNTEHKYTVDENGLATVNDNAEGTEGEDYFIFTGGYITGGRGNSSCGGGINNSGTLNMNGGAIIGNSATRGGGIYNYGTSNIVGGQIIYNTSNGWGGGIYLTDVTANMVNLTGGSITNNKATNGGGIHASKNTKVNISDSPIVLDNLSVNNNPNNLNLADNAVISVIGDIDSSASIGVKKSSGTGKLTESENTDYNIAERFVSDNTDYVVGKDAQSGQLKLHTPYTVIWKNFDGSTIETDTGLAEGTVPTYDGETPVKPEDEDYTYTFEGWTPEVVAATADAQYTATFTAVPKIKTYTVTWQNYDGTTLETDEDVAEGTVPTYNGATPTKPDDEHYTYSFDKWSPDVSAVSGDITYTATFKGTQFIAKVGDKKFTTFSDAVEESEKTKGGAVITLLANADAPYSMNNLTLDVLRVKHSGYSADITDYNKKETNKGITYYFRTDDKVYVDGTGDDDDNVEIAAGVAATVIVVGTGVEVVLGAGASVVVEGAAASSVNVDVSDSESECLEEEEQEDGSKKYTNHKFHWVTIDTGISILDAGAEVMPDCVNDIWATYNQNIATIVKILPPVLTVIGYTDVILKFPYPEGWFFPPIPYLPEAMNPGSHFVAFFEGAGYSTYGTPFVGKTITEDLEITGVWVPYEAAVIKDNGDREYYLQFSEAAEKRDGKIVEILSAPLFNYTLQKISENPDVYEILRVKRGKYIGECVDAPPNLPEGYYKKVWTYEDEVEGTITCYTITNEYTVKWVVNGVTVEVDEDAEYGSMPEYNGETPASYFDGNYKYTFSGWSPQISPVTQSVTYTATYTAESVDGFNLSLDDCIHLNLYIDVDDYVDTQNAKLTVTHNAPDKQSPTAITETYSGEELIALKDEEDGRYVVKVLAAPAQLRDEMTVTLYNGEEYIRSFTVSVKDYCEAIINLYKDSEDTKKLQLVELAKTMLDYGKACSDNFNYNEDAFAAQDYINTDDVAIEGSITLSGNTSVLKSFSYVAKSIPSLRINLNKTEAQCVADGLVATVIDANGNTREIKPTVVEGTTRVCLDITGILAENFDGINTIEYDGATLTLNVNQFAKVKGGNFGRSLYNYGVAAKNYFKN